VFRFTLPVWAPQPADPGRPLPLPDGQPPEEALVGSGGERHP